MVCVMQRRSNEVSVPSSVLLSTILLRRKSMQKVRYRVNLYEFRLNVGY